MAYSVFCYTIPEDPSRLCYSRQYYSRKRFFPRLYYTLKTSSWNPISIVLFTSILFSEKILSASILLLYSQNILLVFPWIVTLPLNTLAPPPCSCLVLNYPSRHLYFLRSIAPVPVARIGVQSKRSYGHGSVYF